MKSLIAFALMACHLNVFASNKIVAKLELENTTSYQEFGNTLQVVLRKDRVVEVIGKGAVVIDQPGNKPNETFYIAHKVEEKRYADLPEIAEILNKAELEMIERANICKKMAPSFEIGLLLMPTENDFKPVYTTDECWRGSMIRPVDTEALAQLMVDYLSEIAEDLVYEYQARK